MSILASSTFDAGTTGNSVPTNGSDLFTSGSAAATGFAKYDTAHIHGASGKSCHLQTSVSGDSVFRQYDYGTAVSVAVLRGYFYMTALPAVSMTPIALYSGATKIMDVRVGTTGIVNIRNVNSAVGGNATTVAINTLYRWEVKVTPNPSGGTMEFRLFSGAALEADVASYTSHITGAADGSVATTANQWRVNLSGGLWDIWVDDLAFGDVDWINAPSKAIDGSLVVTAGATTAWSHTMSLAAAAVATAAGSADGSVIHVGGGVTEASTGFQSGTIGNSVPTNGTDLFTSGSVAGTGTAKYDSANTHLGTTRSMHLAAPVATDSAFRHYDLSVAKAVGAVRGYFTLGALPTSPLTILSMYSGGGKVADVRVLATGLLQVRDFNTQVDQSTIAIVPGTQYRIEWKVGPNPTTGSQSLKIASGSHLDVASQTDEPMLTGNARLTGSTTIDQIRVCVLGDVADLWVDDYAVGDTDFLGPSVSGKVIDAALAVTAAATASAVRQPGIGGSGDAVASATADTTVVHGPGFGIDWVIKPVKVWNGSAWVVKPVKVWDGTTWVTKIVKAQASTSQPASPFPIAGTSVITARGVAGASVTSTQGSQGILVGSSFQNNGITGWKSLDTRLATAISLQGTYLHPPWLMRCRRTYQSSLAAAWSGHPAANDPAGVVSIASIKTGEGGTGSGQMASGQLDTALKNFILSIPLGIKVYLGWEHEPENPSKGITQPNFKNGWARFCKLIVKYRGARDITPFWCLMASTGRAGNSGLWNPGAALLAPSVPTYTGGPTDGTLAGIPLSSGLYTQDGYLHASYASPTTTFGLGFSDMRTAGWSRFGISETGVDNGNTISTLAVARQWLTDLTTLCRGMSGMEYVAYFDSTVGADTPYGWDLSDPGCQVIWANFCKNG